MSKCSLTERCYYDKSRGAHRPEQSINHVVMVIAASKSFRASPDLVCTYFVLKSNKDTSVLSWFLISF